MEKQITMSMSEIKSFGLTCPNCHACFVRTLDELIKWHDMADPKLGEEHESFCSVCRKKEVKRHRETHSIIGSLLNLWRSSRSQEIGLSFIASEQRGEKAPENN